MTSQQRITIFKWSVVLIATVVLFLLWKGCNNEGSGKKQTDTISVKIDTVWMSSKSDTFYTPGIVKTEWRTTLKYKTDTLQAVEYVVVDTSLIIREYFATRYYQDSVAVQYGKVYINDTVTQNKIKSRGVSTKFNIPVVKETITLRQPKRSVAYIGFEGLGNQGSIVYAVGASFGLKVKNDKYYGVKALMSKEGNPLYGLEFKIPIRLGKN